MYVAGTMCTKLFESHYISLGLDKLLKMFFLRRRSLVYSYIDDNCAELFFLWCITEC